MLEFALIVAALLLLTMGLIQFGIIMNAANNLSQIAREGARFAAVHACESTADAPASTTPPDDKSVRSYINLVCSRGHIKYSEIGDGGVTITGLPANSAACLSSRGQPVTVTISYDMRRRLFLPAGFPGLGRFNSPYTTAATFVIE